MAIDDIVGVDDIAPALTHLFAIGTQDHALVEDFLKWFFATNYADIVKEFVPKPSIEKMQNGMLGAADVQIDG